MDTRIEWINLKVNDNDDNLLLKINCKFCQKPFTEKDIKGDDYRFIVNYANVDCFGGKPKYNKLEKKGNKYFLSLEIIRVEHKHHYAVKES